MSEIRYWDSDPARGVRSGSDSRVTRSAVDRYDKSFQASLLGQLSQLEGDALLSGGGSTNMAASFGGKGPQLMDLDIPGIEKVWAAQLSTPESYLGLGNADKSADPTGLGGMLDLMIREQTLKARESLGADRYSMEEFVKDISGDMEAIESKVPGMDNQEYASLDEFIGAIQQQLRQASSQFGVSEQELRQRLVTGQQGQDETQRRRIRTW